MPKKLNYQITVSGEVAVNDQDEGHKIVQCLIQMLSSTGFKVNDCEWEVFDSLD